MKEWKIRQQTFDMLNGSEGYKDDLNDVDINLVEGDEIIDEAIRHFNEYVDEWIYPSKSYVVAICYASRRFRRGLLRNTKRLRTSMR